MPMHGQLKGTYAANARASLLGFKKQYEAGRLNVCRNPVAAIMETLCAGSNAEIEEITAMTIDNVE